jgi:hypothetical protein
MAQKVAFKVTAVIAKVKEHSTNLEKITGRGRKNMLSSGQHNYTLLY